MELAIVALLVVTPLVVFLGRIAFLPNGITFDDLLRRTDLDWPRGVQEEEPTPWHVERLPPRSRMVSPFTTLMPIFMLMTSASTSRIERATNWSSWHWPANPKHRRSTPASRAATAGHVPVGCVASRQWLIELP